MAARNMWRIEIDIQEKIVPKFAIYKDHSRMHGQQNIKLSTVILYSAKHIYIYMFYVILSKTYIYIYRAVLCFELLLFSREPVI